MTAPVGYSISSYNYFLLQYQRTRGNCTTPAVSQTVILVFSIYRRRINPVVLPPARLLATACVGRTGAERRGRVPVASIEGQVEAYFVGVAYVRGSREIRGMGDHSRNSWICA